MKAKDTGHDPVQDTGHDPVQDPRGPRETRKLYQPSDRTDDGGL